MAMSGYYLDPDSSDAESIRTIQRAVELGVTHIDAAEIYGGVPLYSFQYDSEFAVTVRQCRGCGRRSGCGRR